MTEQTRPYTRCHRNLTADRHLVIAWDPWLVAGGPCHTSPYMPARVRSQHAAGKAKKDVHPGLASNVLLPLHCGAAEFTVLL